MYAYSYGYNQPLNKTYIRGERERVLFPFFLVDFFWAGGEPLVLRMFSHVNVRVLACETVPRSVKIEIAL